METEIIIDPESLRPEKVKYYPPLPDIEFDPESLGKTTKGVGGPKSEIQRVSVGYFCLGLAIGLTIAMVLLVVFEKGIL